MSKRNPTRRDVLRGAGVVAGVAPVLVYTGMAGAAQPGAVKPGDSNERSPAVANTAQEASVLVVRTGHCRGGWTALS